MLNKFWNFQRILGSSMQFDKTKTKINSDFLSNFVNISSLIVLIIMFNGFSIIIYSIGASLLYTYKIINSHNKLYESLPVSRKYIYMNIILRPYILISTVYFFIIILVPLFEFIFNSLFNMSLIKSFTGISIIPFVSACKAIIFAGGIAIMIISFLIPVFFIKKKTLRKVLINSIVVLVTIIAVIKKTLPIYKGKGEIGFINSILTNNSLLILFCACIVIIPISNFLSYRIYMGRSLKYD